MLWKCFKSKSNAFKMLQVKVKWFITHHDRGNAFKLLQVRCFQNASGQSQMVYNAPRQRQCFQIASSQMLSKYFKLRVLKLLQIPLRRSQWGLTACHKHSKTCNEYEQRVYINILSFNYSFVKEYKNILCSHHKQLHRSHRLIVGLRYGKFTRNNNHCLIQTKTLFNAEFKTQPQIMNAFKFDSTNDYVLVLTLWLFYSADSITYMYVHICYNFSSTHTCE